MPMHVSYVLLAEFDIDEGSVLKHQHPCPTGTNEHLLAEHMLPDGAHDRADDWTVFYLNQVPELTVDPKLLQQHHLEHPDAVSLAGTPRPDERPGELLYVLSLVRTKKVATVRRGALVKALAVATYNPYIQIFKPILLLALDDYFRDPSVACLARLYDSINAMDTTCCPRLSLDERLVLRTSERKDMFEEKFVDSDVARTPAPQYSPSDTREVLESSETSFRFDQRSASSDSIASKDANNFSDGASWKSRARADTIGSSEEVHLTAGEGYPVRFPPSRAGASFNSGRPRDTHSFDTTLFYADSVSPPVPIPTRIPLATFPGEVGDYSLIKLIQIFSTPAALVSTGALHAHLHTNGHLTHPILLLFNALVTHKRVIFLGHGQPAGEVANLVLAACALASGCGAVFKGVPERAFPYTNLTNLDNLQTVPGFIAGVCNPAFAEHPDWWDVLCNIESGKIIVSKDIRPASFSARSLSSTMRSQTAVDFTGGFQDVDELGRITSPSANAQTKSDATDSIFMDEISTAIQSHFGEAAIRARFTDYAARFVRMASKYEEETTGSTSIGFPSANFAPATGTQASSLGSGAIYADDMTKAREMASNAGRIEGWRVTPSYALCQSAFQDQNNDSPIRSFDLVHQIARLRYGKNVPPAEALLIFKALSSKIRTDEEVIAFLALLPPHLGGLLPIGFGLFHPSETIRDATVDLFDTLNAHPTGNKFLQTLNAFHLSAYNRLSQDRLDTDAF